MTPTAAHPAGILKAVTVPSSAPREVMTMPEPVELRTDGPHSAEYTMQVAYALAEAARVLNYATMPGAGGLDYPGDAYSLLGALYTATERLPQLFGQLTAFLAGQRDAGKLADDHARNVAAQVARAAFRLAKAHG